MFNNLEIGTTIRFYLDYIGAYTVGVIEGIEEGRYKVGVNGIGVSSIYVEFDDIKEVIDKNKKFEPIIEEEIIEEEIIEEEPFVEPIIEEEEFVEERIIEEPIMQIEEPIIEIEEPVMEIEEPIVEDKKSHFFGLFDDGGVAEMVTENLPNELTIYVPLFDVEGKPVSNEQIESRVSEVQSFMKKYFGDFTDKNVSGSYVDEKGNLIMKKNIQISAFPTDEEFNHYKRNLINQLSMWASEWTQDVAIVEYEDKIYYIYPMDDMMKNGGELWIQEATKDMKKSGTVGAFTKQAKREGLTPIEFAKKVLAKPQGYTIKTRRRANFVKNTNPDKF